MHDGGGGGGSTGGDHGGHAPGGGQHSGSGQHSGGGQHRGGGDSGSGHGSSGAGGSDPSRQRAPSPDSLDPLGPMGMPKILSRVADRAGRGQQGSGTVAAGLYVISVLAIIIAFLVVFIIQGH